MNAHQLSGTWYNELHAVLHIQVQGNQIIGTYQTAAGNAEDIYPLIGLALLDNEKSNALGFLVVWQNQYGNSQSVTTWSGEFRQDESGNQAIVTTWLLTAETDDGDCTSMTIGKDLFTRTPPTAEQVAHNTRKGIQASHPIRLTK